ncbi:hypothetical protein REH81_03470 [Vibrio rotiferianus]
MSPSAYVYLASLDRYNIKSVNIVFLAYIVIITIVIGFLSYLLNRYLWIGDLSLVEVALGYVATSLLIFQQRFTEISDVEKDTYKNEKDKIFSRLAFALILLFLLFYQNVNAAIVFGLLIFSYLLYLSLISNRIRFKSKFGVSEDSYLIAKDFYLYMKPLMIFSIISALYSFSGKYLIQNSTGSVEQGYYMFAFQLSMISIAFITALVPIYLSRMTKMVSQSNHRGMQNLFNIDVCKLFIIQLTLCAIIFFFSDGIIIVLVGNDFLGAGPALKYLCLFSLMHVFGVLGGNIFLASNRNTLYTRINCIFMLIGCALMFTIDYRHSLDSRNLAMIMSLVYTARVVVQMYFNIIYLRLNIVSFLSRLFVTSGYIIIPIYLISTVAMNLYLSIFMVIIFLLISNFIFGDYLDLKKIVKV